MASSFDISTFTNGNPLPDTYNPGPPALTEREDLHHTPYGQEKIKSSVTIPAFLPWFDELQTLGETPEMRIAYRRMLADPHVKSAVLKKIFSVASLDLVVKPPKYLKRDERSKKIAEFCEWCLTSGIHGGVPGFIWSIMSGALIDGVSVCEKVWGEVEPKGRWAGKRRLAELKPKDVDQDLVLEVDEYKKITGVKALRFNAGTVFDPKDFVIYQHLPLYGGPAGMSDLRAAYRAYWLLDTVWKLRAIACDKRSLPLIVAHFKDPSQQRNLDLSLAKIRSQNWLSAPEETRLEAINIAGQADQIYDSTIKALREDVVIGINGAVLTSMTSSDERGNSEVHKDTSDLNSWQLSAAALSILNDHKHGLIREIVDTNFQGVDEYPTAAFGGIDDKELAESLRVDEGLSRLIQPMGLQLVRDELEDRYGRTFEDAPKPPGGGMPGMGGPGAPPPGMPGQPAPAMPGAPPGAPPMDSQPPADAPPGAPMAAGPDEDMGDPGERADAMADIMSGAMGGDAEALDAVHHSNWREERGPRGGHRWVNPATGKSSYHSHSEEFTSRPAASDPPIPLPGSQTGRAYAAAYQAEIDVSDDPAALTEAFFAAFHETGGDWEASWDIANEAVELAEEFSMFGEADWRLDPGPRSRDRWVNVKTGRKVYSKVNPGVAKAPPRAPYAPSANQMSLFDLVDEDEKLTVEPPKPDRKPDSPKVEPAKDVAKPDETGPKPEHPPRVKLAQHLRDHLNGGKSIDAKSLWAAANDHFGGTRTEGKYGPSDAYDSMESAFNLHLRGKTHPQAPIDHALTEVADLEERTNALPTQTNRSGNKDTFQQFSTPPHLAYATVWAANLNEGDRVLEPSAGTGSLAVHAENAGAVVHTNELDPQRAALLAHHFGADKVTGENAEHIGSIYHQRGVEKFDAVVMNPPFSATAGRLNKKVLETGAKHIEAAAGTLKPGGRLVAIVGRGMRPDAARYAPWFKKMADDGYILRANVGVNGENYRKYGTSFDNRVLVFDNVNGFTGIDSHGHKWVNGEQVKRDELEAGPERTAIIGDVETIPELMEKLEEVRNDRLTRDDGQQSPGEQAGDAVLAPAGGEAGAGISAPDAGDARNGVDELAVGVPDGSDAAPQLADPGSGDDAGAGLRDGDERSGVEPAVDAASRPRRTRKRPQADVAAGDGEAPGAQPGGQPDNVVADLAKPVAVPFAVLTGDADVKHDELTDSLYEPYHPQRLKIDGAQKHVTSIVESAAMSGVQPPEPTYHPTLSPDLVAMKEVTRVDKDGRKSKVKIGLSEAGLEAVIYAGQAHQQFLPAEDDLPPVRRGFLVGDGTGVGKGRITCGVMMDNWNQGRKKHVWVSEKWRLANDAKRDWADMGGDPNKIFTFDQLKKSPESWPADGICFITYDTLKGEEKTGDKTTNIERLKGWLGKDFDGVVAFDEAHNMANSMESETGFGTKGASQKAMKGIEFQQQTPNARVLYLSATSATELQNLGYLDRLGLWGKGTPFAGKGDFIAKMHKGGVAAMEAISQSMKAMGSYIARSISMSDGTEAGSVQYDRATHHLTEEQKANWSTMSDAWQNVLKNIDKALEHCGAGDDAKSRGRARGQFFGQEQAFFNQVLTSMQVPTLIENIKKDLADGRSAVIQMTNTGEAATKNALKNRKPGQDLDELDVSPKQILINFLEHSFPTDEMHEEEYGEPNDKGVRPTHMVPVKDSNGNIVKNAAAVAMRDEMVQKIKDDVRIPDAPLDQIINAFGEDAVAEVSGRGVRLAWQRDQKTGELVKTELKRNSTKENPLAINDFQDGKKRILLFSGAGNTGGSYHADMARKNQEQRVHYLLQAGWRADGAMQGFGRTHRTNQKQAPIYRLCEVPEVPGHKRFISTIARRLNQLGALSKGERRAGGGGIFKESDNLESKEASLALTHFVMNLKHGAYADKGLHYEDVMNQMGYDTQGKDGKEKKVKELAVKDFLNRILPLRLETQQKLFDVFSKELDDQIEYATTHNTLDAGVENFKAKSAVRKSEEVVYRHPESGAEVKHVVVTATNPTELRHWDENSKGEKPYKYVTNRRSGRVYAVWPMSDGTNERGNVTSRRMLRGPKTKSNVATGIAVAGHSSARKYDEISEDEAKRLWHAEFDAADKTETSDHHFFSGALLPVWDKLPNDMVRVSRVRTDDGKVFVGRTVPGGLVDDVLRNLGHSIASTSDDSPAAVHARLSDHKASVRLGNGWKLSPKRLQNEKRIELIGPSSFYESQLKGMGVIREKVGADWHWYVPTGAAGVKIMETLAKDHKIANVSTLKE